VSFSVDETSAATGLSPRSIRRAIWAGQLRALRSGRRVIVPAEAIPEFLASLASAETR
jgi:excisionase family DNA binding protein